MPRISRLRSGRQHLAVRNLGRSFHGNLIRFSVLEGGGTVTQCAAVVSKRVGGAVVRNRIKRRLREIFRTERPRLRIGLWIVVTAKPHAADASIDAIRSEWLRLASRLSIFADC